MSVRLNKLLLARSVGIALAANLAIGPSVLAAGCPSGGVAPTTAQYVMSGFTEVPPKDGSVATNLSGLACRAGPGSVSTCLVVDDSSRIAQAARLDGVRLAPHGPVRPGGGPGDITLITASGPAVPAVGVEPGRELGGRASRLGCDGGRDGFKDLDGEAVAFDGEHFYVTGSHGCSRKKAKLRASAFLLARMRLSDAGEMSGLQMSYHLSTALKARPELEASFAQPLNGEPPGLNVEGMAASGGKLVFGLRAPLLRFGQPVAAGLAEDGDAVLLSVDAADLFSAEPGPSIRSPGLARVSLGRNTGVRDLATLPDGRLLLLSGPARSDDAKNGAPQPPFRVWAVDAGPGGVMAAKPAVRELACLSPPPSVGVAGKPEAVLVLGPGPQPATIRLLVISDGPENGRPLEYVLPLPPRGAPQ